MNDSAAPGLQRRQRRRVPVAFVAARSAAESSRSQWSSGESTAVPTRGVGEVNDSPPDDADIAMATEGPTE